MERRLAAILVADVVGYSGMMERDEAGTFERLRAHRRELAEPVVASHRGRIFKLTGDGYLVEFGSVVDAVECAAAIQTGMAQRNRDIPDGKRIDLRIGVHVGDVIVEGEDCHGDAVNVAARLQEAAEAGGICVSRTVVDQVRQKVALVFESRGEERLKNIAEPISIYRIRVDGIQPEQRPILALPDRPSIAVLSFQNMSGDPEQEYFADGTAEEIITALSHLRWLFVIARNSSFTYKGRAVDVKQIGRELGVRYVLEGSVRKAGNKVRVTGQLIDAATGAHLWADRFDGALEDVFDLQDRVTASVVNAIAPKMEQAELERSKHKPTESLDAYDYYLRGIAVAHRWTREANAEALAHFCHAVELDPNFAAAWGLAARCYSQRKACGWSTDGAREATEAERAARRAAELGQDDAMALCTAGMAMSYVVCNPAHGRVLIDRALQLNPNLAWAWLFSGWTSIWLGDPETGIEHVARAMRLSPHDPQMVAMQGATAYAHFFAGRNAEASKWAEMSIQSNPNLALPFGVLVAARTLMGQPLQAAQALARLRSLEPELRLSNLGVWMPLQRLEHLDLFVDAIRKAGLPE
ncbi:MAG: adenylate/guanylate cyclase domain-containing protein [Dongiaceae bacterium]